MKQVPQAQTEDKKDAFSAVTLRRRTLGDVKDRSRSCHFLTEFWIRTAPVESHGESKKHDDDLTLR